MFLLVRGAANGFDALACGPEVGAYGHCRASAERYFRTVDRAVVRRSLEPVLNARHGTGRWRYQDDPLRMAIVHTRVDDSEPPLHAQSIAARLFVNASHYPSETTKTLTVLRQLNRNDDRAALAAPEPIAEFKTAAGAQWTMLHADLPRATLMRLWLVVEDGSGAVLSTPLEPLASCGQWGACNADHPAARVGQ